MNFADRRLKYLLEHPEEISPRERRDMCRLSTFKYGNEAWKLLTLEDIKWRKHRETPKRLETTAQG